MARRSPPHFFRRATIEEERTFQGVKVSREIHPAAKFSLCFDDSLSTCIVDVENFFVSLVLFTILLWDSSLFFLWFNFFKWYTREEDSSREEMTNEISYLLEMKRVWSSLEVNRLTKKTWELYFFRIFWTLILFFFWNLKITLKGKFASEIYFIFRKWNVFWWKGLIFVKFTTFCPLPCNLIKMIIFVKWMEKFEYIRLYKFF